RSTHDQRAGEHRGAERYPGCPQQSVRLPRHPEEAPEGPFRVISEWPLFTVPSLPDVGLKGAKPAAKPTGRNTRFRDHRLSFPGDVACAYAPLAAPSKTKRTSSST